MNSSASAELTPGRARICRHAACARVARIAGVEWLRGCRRSTWARARSSSEVRRWTARPPTIARSSRGEPGMTSRAARESTRRIRSDPLMAATSGLSSRVAVVTSSTSPSERRVTDSSPSEGSTRSMYAV